MLRMVYYDYKVKNGQIGEARVPKSYSEQERTYIKKRLKEEAAKCLAKYGVRRTTVDEIVRRVHIPKGTFYLFYKSKETSVYKGYKQDKIEMRGDRAEMSDFPLYLNTVAGGLDRRDQTIGGFSFVVKIYAVPVVEIIG